MENLQRLRAFYASLTPQRRMSLTASVFVSLAITAALWGWATYDPYVPLFDQPLDPKTTAEVLEQLKAEQIDYKLERGTDRLLVPDSSRDQLALTFRGSSLFAGKGTGLEILEDNKFGSTRFVEHVRWVRGLQGEIERQINGFGQVLGSKVLLSIPEETLFAEDHEDPSASVYVELKSGMTLSAEEGGRMASLVAAAVPRLRPTRVEILDSNMRVIHAAQTDDDETGIGGKMADLQRHYERYYQGKIEGLLERILGPGNVVARVSVDLDNAERSVQRRELDGDRAVTISSRTRESSSSGGSGEQGVPGTTANLPELAVTTGGSGSSETAEADEVTNIDVPETRSITASLPGGILGVTAAVVIDGIWEAAPVEAGTEGAEQGAEAVAEKTYRPRDAEELAQYKEIVAQAIGAPLENVSVINRPFAQVNLTSAAPQVTPFQEAFSWVQLVKYSIALLALALTFFMVVRPTMRRVNEAPSLEEQQQIAATAVASLPGAAVATGPDGEMVAGGQLEDAPSEEALAQWLETVSSGARHVTREEVNRLVATDLAHTVVTLQSWIQEEA